MRYALLPLACVLLAGCSGGTVSSTTSSDGGKSSSGPGAGTGDDPGSGDTIGGGTTGGDPGTTGGTADGGATGDGGGTGGGGTGGDGGSSAGGVFADAGAYTPTLGPSARNAKHTGLDGNAAGQACLSCHDGQTKGNVVEFLFAGTLWTTPAATTPLPMAEVRVIEATGNPLVVHTDGDGNFFFPRGTRGPLASPAHGGARDAKGAELMTNVFNDGDCNSCHRAGGQAPINLP